MKSKIIFVLLFMLTFTIMHDSVINIIQKNDPSTLSHYVDNDNVPQKYTDIHEMHNMFHFVGLIMTYKLDFIHSPEKEMLTQKHLQYTPPHKDSSYKPPIV